MSLRVRIAPPDTDALWDAYLACRYRNLYAPYGLPTDCTTSELDSPRARPGILHRAAIAGDGERVVGCARLDLQPDRPGGPAAQVRYFATDADQRGLGVGRLLLLELEKQAAAAGIAHVWMEARVEALGFYSRCGYTDAGPGPTKWNVIHHRIMEKVLPTPGAVPSC